MHQRTCPSGRCQEGSLLLGEVQEDQRVAFVHPAIPVDAEFVAQASDSAQRRFRFAEACVASGCAQWTGERCGVIDEVLTAARTTAPQLVVVEAPLPYCGIRSSCRWFHQSGRAACRVCRFVVTDTTAEGSSSAKPSGLV
ncbi:MAG TPA: hypothetical protein VHT30_01470 [Acidimicrobiales bacterium]|jgi:hypothetical protein|nr:hypothetical protein [Acidimicrobiales bacterium]